MFTGLKVPKTPSASAGFISQLISLSPRDDKVAATLARITKI